MTSRKDIFNKYYESDIFNTNPNYRGVTPIASTTRPRIRYNHSSLDNTKEDVFNIGKEKRINRNVNRNEHNNERLNHSAEKRKKNLSKIYGSDIFNIKEENSKERKKGIQRINDNYKSTCFEEMKNNDEYVKNLKYYTKQHRGEKKPYNPDLYIHIVSPQERYFDSQYGNNCEGVLPGTYLHSEGNIDESKLKYIKKKINLHKDERLFNDVGADKKRKEGERVKEGRYLKNHPFSNAKGDKRRFVDIGEFPENSCRINKQIQFESHIFTNDNNNYNKTNDEINEINDRIYKEKNKHYHIDVLGQPIIKVNRNKNIVDKNTENQKLRPANIKWNSPQAEVMFGRDHSSDIYRRYGPKGPNAHQLKLYQYADSGNVDTLNGIEKHKYQSVGRKNHDEILNNETSKKIEKMVEDIPNLSDRKKYEIKMRTSVLDCNNDNEWDYKSKTLNEFYKKGNNKKINQKEVTQKVNKNDKTIKENKNSGVHDFVITYATKGNQFEKFNDNDIKKMFGAKGINVFDIHKNPFSKGSYNTISLKVYGNDNNNEISKKVQLVQDDLKKKNYKINIEKEKEKNYNIKHKRIMNNPGSKIGIIPDVSYNNGESKFKVMPNDYKKRKGFTKEFKGINHAYKRPNQ